MKLIELKAKLSEEVLETVLHFSSNEMLVYEDMIVRAIDKTPAYIRKGLIFLEQIELIRSQEGRILISEAIFAQRSSPPNILIREAILKYKPLIEYLALVSHGKTELKSAKLLKASLNIDIDAANIVRVFNGYKKFLEVDSKIFMLPKNTYSGEFKKATVWVDGKGKLRPEGTVLETKTNGGIDRERFSNALFVDQERINSLKSISNPLFDLSKLIRMCEELNDAFRSERYLSVGVLTRALMDHIPPIFRMKNFSEVANNYGPRSFKDVMSNLEGFNRKIADSILHTQIRKKESLPNSTTVDCRSGVDVLLGEIINELK